MLKEVNLFVYRPWRPLWLQEVEAKFIYIQAMEALMVARG
jgi:hypothetical protein